MKLESKINEKVLKNRQAPTFPLILHYLTTLGHYLTF
jgi:hypothetical protein